MYMYSINLYPSLSLTNLNHNKTVEVSLVSSNLNSQNQISIKLTTKDITSDLSKEYIFLIFLGILIFYIALTLIIFNYNEKRGIKDQEKRLKTEGDRLRTESQRGKEIDRKSLKKIEEKLEILNEQIEHLDSDDEDKDDLRKSLGYVLKFHESELMSKGEDDFKEDSGINSSIRMSYHRSSTNEFNKTLFNKKQLGFKKNQKSTYNEDVESKFDGTLEKRIDEEEDEGDKFSKSKTNSTIKVHNVKNLHPNDIRFISTFRTDGSIFQTPRINESFIESKSSSISNDDEEEGEDE